MKAYVIKNKDGKYFGVANNYNYEHYWTTLDFAHYFRYFEGHDAKTEAEEYKNTRYPDCEVVEITIAEGDLEHQLAEKNKEIERLKKELAVFKATVKLKGHTDSDKFCIVDDKQYFEMEQTIRHEICEEIRTAVDLGNVFNDGTIKIGENDFDDILKRIEGERR